MTSIDSISTIVMRHFGINDGTAIVPNRPVVITESTLLTAARAVAARTKSELMAAMHREAKDIRDAVASHSSVAEHYWQDRHRLQRQCEAMDAIIAVLEEELGA